MLKDVPRQTNVVIIGSGVIGASIAYHLAQSGLAVCVVEAKGLVAETSANCDGAVATLTKKPGLHLDLAVESLHYLRKLGPTLPLDIESHGGGSLAVAGTAAEVPVLEQLMADRAGSQSPLEWLSGDELRRREPAFSPEVVAATYCPEDELVSPYRLTIALIKGAESFGAQVVTWAPVTDFLCHNHTVVGVRTARGDIRCQQVVLAAGVFSPGLGQKLGLDIPVVPCRGQIVVTEPMPRIVKGASVVGADYLVMKHSGLQAGTGSRHDRAELWEKEPLGGFGMECTMSGTVLINGTKEFVGFDRSTTPIGIQGILRRALRMLPMLRKAVCIRTFAGLRPQTPDGLPIVGRPRGIEALYVVTGHSSDGIALAAITGKLAGEELIGQNHAVLLRPFSPDRFAAQATAGDLGEQKEERGTHAS